MAQLNKTEVEMVKDTADLQKENKKLSRKKTKQRKKEKQMSATIKH